MEWSRAQWIGLSQAQIRASFRLFPLTDLFDSRRSAEDVVPVSHHSKFPLSSVGQCAGHIVRPL